MQLQSIAGVETHAVAHVHERFVFRYRLGDRDPDRAGPGTRRCRRRFQNRRILCRDGNRIPGNHRIGIEFRLGRHVRGERDARPRTGEHPQTRAHGTGHQFRIRF